MSAAFGGILVSEIEPITRWNPRTGVTKTRRWKGEQNNIAALEAELRLRGIEYDTQFDGGYVILSADYPEDDTQPIDKPLSDEWERERNLVQKSLWLHPDIQAEFKKVQDSPPLLASERRAAYVQDFDSYIRGETSGLRNSAGNEYTISLPELLVIAQDLGMDALVFQTLFELRSKQVDAFYIISYVYKRNLVTNKSSILKASDENVMKIFTVDAMKTKEGFNEETAKFTLAPGYYLKIPAKVNQEPRSKWSITQEYWHADSFEPFLYGDPITG